MSVCVSWQNLLEVKQTLGNSYFHVKSHIRVTTNPRFFPEDYYFVRKGEAGFSLQCQTLAYPISYQGAPFQNPTGLYKGRFILFFLLNQGRLPVGYDSEVCSSFQPT